MTTAKKITHLPTIKSWLTNTLNKSADEKYYHRRLEEELAFRSVILTELQRLVHNAHEDARQRYRNALDISNSLDPLEEETTPGIDTSIIDDFPRYLELTTLKGYFGEIMAAVIAENFSPLDEDWYVPAFPFRYHQPAYHALEQLRQEGSSAPTIIGRFGDDMLAFQRNDQGQVTHALVCEAKCSAAHSLELVADAHTKASAKNPVPVDCFQLAEMLKEYEATDPEAAKWRQGIRNLILKPISTYERCDLINYILGLPPVRATTVVITTDKPHVNYTGGRRLEAVEIHLHDVDGLIEEVYQAITLPITSNISIEELSTLWERIMSFVPSNKQSLLVKHCSLVSFDGQTAFVNVSSLSVFREILRRKQDIKDAFINSGVIVLDESQQGINLKLRVGSCA